MSGWYRMHRGWMDHALFRGEAFSRRDAFQWLIQNAAFQPGEIGTKGGTIELARGQLSYSIRYMASAWKWDEKKVRRFLTAARDAEIIALDTAAGQTIITICNYGYYQADQRGGAAPDAAATPHQRRGGAANNKEGEEGKKEEVARARARGGAEYAFMGNTVRLTAEHFNGWVAAYPNIANLRGELERIDAWWERQAPEKRDNWFARTSGMLDKRNRENAATAQRVQSEADRIAAEADSRRREWERNNPDLVARYAELDALAARARAEEGSLH